MFIHNVIKLKYVNEGYLPNYPYHLISDEEMCGAFLNESGSCYFYDKYYCVDDMLSAEYTELVSAIKQQLSIFISSTSPDRRLPDWVYTYMLGEVVSDESPTEDKHDLLMLLNLDNIDDVFTPQASASCFKISKIQLSKIPDKQREGRVPTIFGDPGVIKQLRLMQLEVT